MCHVLTMPPPFIDGKGFWSTVTLKAIDLATYHLSQTAPNFLSITCLSASCYVKKCSMRTRLRLFPIDSVAMDFNIELTAWRLCMIKLKLSNLERATYGLRVIDS